MKNKMLCSIALVTLFFIFLTETSIAEMSSDNYTITKTVLSGGGSPMGSTNYQMNSTLGQPSPLMEQGMDPYSDNFGLLPGFWYTLDAGSGCIYDYLDDGDVDGADLAEFVNAVSSSELEAFALEFGRVDCLP
jgi:hypothetical protein